MNPADQQQQTAPVLAGAEAPEAPASASRAAAPRLLSIAADGIAARLRALSERPHAISVREVIDRYMAAYTGTDTTIVQRLTTWHCQLDATAGVQMPKSAMNETGNKDRFTATPHY